jgi:serine/threonine protein phosphatase PrpC
VAHWISKHIIDELLNNENYKTGDYHTALKETFLALDKRMATEEETEVLKTMAKELTKDKDGRMQAGSTATTVLITPDKIICANAGDSRTVISKRGGEPQALSKDHKPELELERKRIEAANGHVQNGRVNGTLAVSRALGDFSYKWQPELEPTK